MDRETSLELLNATHSFPCPFTLKVIGKSTTDFAERCEAAIREIHSEAEEIPFTVRSTPNGRHTAVTLSPTLESAEQVLDVYARLRKVEGVVMAM